MANIFGTKRDIDNPARALGSADGLLHCPKVSRTWVHKRVKIGPDLLPTLSILFRLQSIAHALAALTWRPTANLNETALGLSAAHIRSPKEILS